MTEPKQVVLYAPNGQRVITKGTARKASYGRYRGGIRNPSTGVGGTADKVAAAYFLPTIWNTRRIPTTIYTESWAARAAVDIPAEDMMIRWRKWEDDVMEKAERKLDFKRRIKAALIGSRLYGSTILCMMTNEDNLLRATRSNPDSKGRSTLSSRL